MTIELLKACYISGSLADAGSQHTLSISDEAYLVHTGLAQYVTAPVKAGKTARVVLSLDSEGNPDAMIGQNGEPYVAWDDLRFPVNGINPAGSASPPTVDDTTFGGSLLFAHNAENIVAGIAQMPHAWLRGSEIHPHVHWSKSTSAAGGVVWEFAYSISDIGGTFGAYSDWAAATDKVPDSDTAHKHALAAFPAIDMSAFKESTCIAWKVRRNPDATADDYGADARLWEFDIHYQVAKFGTVNEIPS
jgi:hypothetical protein